MNLTRRTLLTLAGLGASAGITACRYEHSEEPPAPEQEPPAEEQPPEEPEIDVHEFDQLAIDPNAWLYDEANDCYFQLALPYCLKPGSAQYGSLSIYVPGPYFEASKKGQTYACTVAETAQVGAYTPQTAPVVMPINSVNYESQECPTTYAPAGLDRYLKAGFVYVYAGFRGRTGGYESTTQEYFSGGAPWPVVDLKAAIRCLRLNATALPADLSRIFVCGQGAGGDVGVLLGVTGGTSIYDAYLAELGAALHDAEGNEISDEINGVACWSPLGLYESADAAYEWMMGQFADEGTRASGTWTSLLSRDLADAYGTYVNGLGLVDNEGTALTLDQIDDGSYMGGPFYDHLIGELEHAAADFLGRTEFPFAALPFAVRQRAFPGDAALATDGAAEAAPEAEEGDAEQTIAGVREIKATVYDTPESYIASLNGDSRWLTYNSSRGQVDITGLWGFVASCRMPQRVVCAYDTIDRSGFANQLFGTDEQPSLHFDALTAQLVGERSERYAKEKDWDDTVVAEWRGDVAETDTLDMTVADRVSLMDALHLLRGEAHEEAHIAAHWRINTGLFQSETTLVGEMGIACALAAEPAVSDVQFEPVWEAGFGLAERKGDPEDNLVAWIGGCCPSEDAVEAESEPEPEEEGGDEGESTRATDEAVSEQAEE